MNLEDLCLELANARSAEQVAIGKRIDVEQKIIEFVGQPDEGSKTCGAGRWSATVTSRVNRTVNWEAWDRIKDEFGQLAPVKIKKELDVPGLKWLQKNRPDLYRKLCECVTSKQGKTSVTIRISDD